MAFAIGLDKRAHSQLRFDYNIKSIIDNILPLYIYSYISRRIHCDDLIIFTSYSAVCNKL